MDKIFIRGLKVEACHGVLDFEKTAPQPFIFDIDLYKDLYRAAKNDDLGETLNYAEVCEKVVFLTQNNCFDLIETLAYSCAYAVLDGFCADKVSVTVHKPQAPVGREFSTVGVTAEVSRTTAYLSLGSSLGDKKGYLDRAIEELTKTNGIKVKKVSSYISTEPYGGVAKNEFLNCAAEIETYLSPRALLDEIHRIEGVCGRERTVHWDDRTLDIDIIFYGNEIIFQPDLIIPHPEYSKRGFVLKPLKEIAPDLICPDTRKRVKDLI